MWIRSWFGGCNVNISFWGDPPWKSWLMNKKRREEGSCATQALIIMAARCFFCRASKRRAWKSLLSQFAPHPLPWPCYSQAHAGDVIRWMIFFWWTPTLWPNAGQDSPANLIHRPNAGLMWYICIFYNQITIFSPLQTEHNRKKIVVTISSELKCSVEHNNKTPWAQLGTEQIYPYATNNNV